LGYGTFEIAAHGDHYNAIRQSRVIRPGHPTQG
jgi:hypothetical protein